MAKFLIVVALVLFNAFFALSEMAVLTSRKSRLKQMATHSAGARKALELANEPEKFLSAVQLWITALGMIIGLLGGESIGESLAVPLSQVPELVPYAHLIGLVFGFLVTLFVVGLLGELVPKRIGTLRPEKIAVVVAYPMQFFASLAKPFVLALSTCTRWVMRLLRLGDTDDNAITEEEIQLIVSESHEQGLIDDDERNMMQRVMRLGDRTVESMMTPRTRIVWLDANASFEENFAEMRETPYSRYPVYRGSDADVLGVLEVKSLLERLESRAPELFKTLRPALFVSESTHALKLLEIFREEQQSLALVVDEYGEVTGMVTVNDLMGAVIGRLQSGETPDAGALVLTRDDGSLLVDGSLPVDELRELIGHALPHTEEHDYHTAAGMVIAHFGRIPNTAEAFEWAGWRIEVVDLDGPRIDKLLLSRVDRRDADEDG
ncbi:MAG: hemolysin family protein [Lysobacteraceae bacterium]